MAQPAANPALTGNGVAFTVTTLDFAKHQCLITAEALAALAPHQSGDFGPLEVFKAYEAKICGVARRMAAANVQGSPLLLQPYSFH